MQNINENISLDELNKIAVSDDLTFMIILSQIYKKFSHIAFNNLASQIRETQDSTLDNKHIILYHLFLTRVNNNMKIKAYDFIDSDDLYKVFNEILTKHIINDVSDVIITRFIIKYKLDKYNTIYLKCSIRYVYKLINSNISLDFIEDKHLFRLLTVSDYYEDKIFNEIKDINNIVDLRLDELLNVFVNEKIFNKLLERGLDVNKIYKYNLNLISLSLFLEDLSFLYKVIELCRLSLKEIDMEFIKDFMLNGTYLDLTRHLEIMSSLENFDDFIKVNYFLFMKISDKQTVEYLKNR